MEPKNPSTSCISAERLGYGADIRAGDYANLLDDERRAILEDQQVRLISYRPRRDLQRGLVHA